MFVWFELYWQEIIINFIINFVWQSSPEDKASELLFINFTTQRERFYGGLDSRLTLYYIISMLTECKFTQFTVYIIVYTMYVCMRGALRSGRMTLWVWSVSGD